ncbi:MAG: site-2 protease family protein [candidate division WOR-3 bacterium]
MREFLLYLPGVLYAMTIHEFFHGFTALKLGDPTAKYSGRLSLNPLKHIDPFGFVALLIAHIGWAKPVPVNPYYFKNPRKDMGIVAISGPLSNIISGILFGILAKFFYPFFYSNIFLKILFYLFLYTAFLNLFFAFFNLIPLFPLDGSHILEAILPYEYYLKYREIERFSPFILLGVIFISYAIPGLNIFYPIVFLPSKIIMSFIFKESQFLF